MRLSHYIESWAWKLFNLERFSGVPFILHAHLEINFRFLLNKKEHHIINNFPFILEAIGTPVGLYQNCYYNYNIPSASGSSSPQLHLLVKYTLKKQYFHFLSHWMEYDRGDNFHFNSEPNRISFGSKFKGKLSSRSYPILCERKWKHVFLSLMCVYIETF